MVARSRRRIATQAAELAWAAPQVVAQRLLRMAAAGTSPSVSDRQEFARMGWEKVAAFHESWLAMTFEAWRVQQAMWWSTLTSLWLPWLPARRRPGRRALLGIVGHGLAPVHRRAVANAKRLRRGR
jgi:hypothetical protein